MPTEPKPNIEELFEAFQAFQSAGTRAVHAGNWEAFPRIREEFKAKLGAWGIADHFDWTER